MATLLLDFVKIGPRTSLYTPQNPVPGQLIIVCTWLGAAKRHIVKYTTIYQSLSPEARILLIESDVRIITSSYKKQREAIKPAVSVVLDTLAECGYYALPGEKTTNGDPSHTIGSSSSSSTIIETLPKILLHMFSNGGTNSATQFLIVLEKRLGSPLPVTGLLFDSCPANGTYWKSHNAMALSLRPKDTVSRIMGAIVVHCILIVLYTWIACGNDNPATLMRRTLLSEEMLTGASSGGDEVKGRACYLFSEADEQVDWMDIKDHAEEARRKGWRVQEVAFEGSGHCAHFSKDSERYAEAMRGLWLDSGDEESKKEY
jgi:Eukaryotic protein of unknown function (DUF829)